MLRSLEVVDVGLPVALVLRLITVAVTLVLARRASWCRLVALGGSIVASAVTVGVGHWIERAPRRARSGVLGQ
jgi:hypothetical protein